VTEEVVHHAGLLVDGSLHLCLPMCKVIHQSLESSDPFYRALSLVNPITDVPLQMSVPVRVPGRGGGSGLEARLRVTMRGIVTTTHMVTRVANPTSSVSLGLLRVMSYTVFMPKPSTHCIHDPGLIVPHIRLKVFTENQMSRIKYNYYISSVSKDYDDSQWNRTVEDSITPEEQQSRKHVA
jgi:hypothetical protein